MAEVDKQWPVDRSDLPSAFVNKDLLERNGVQ